MISGGFVIPAVQNNSLKGPFTNYVDQFLTYSDHLLTYNGLSWTFGALPTPCPRGHRKS